jgi:hypothetical protein
MGGSARKALCLSSALMIARSEPAISVIAASADGSPLSSVARDRKPVWKVGGRDIEWAIWHSARPTFRMRLRDYVSHFSYDPPIDPFTYIRRRTR